jgi:DNA repair protein RecN (Recombination protein N)
LQTQIEALAQLNPSVERIDQLDQEQRRLSHHETLLSGLAEVSQALDGEESAAVRSQLLRCEHELSRLAAIDTALAPLVRGIEEARIGVEEVARETRGRLENSELDPRHLAEVEAALSALHAQARRHRVLVADLPGLLGALRERERELAGRIDRQLRHAELEAELLREYQEHAGRLSQARSDAACKLAEQVNRLIGELGMGGGRFEVEFSPREASEAAADGAEQVEFLVSTNAGMPPRPLRKIASGGELARLSLAIKVATADVEDVPVLVFDEVDSGIGGPTAEIVGRKLRALGQQRQVLSVTHLAQVAACAHQHLRAAKREREGSTVGQLQQLRETERREEVARMLGGIELTEQSLAHADELLQRVQV